MITKQELKGNTFKKELKLRSCKYRYHNKNLSGGNFGLDFFLNENFNEYTDFTLHGEYNTTSEIIKLSIDSIRIGEFVINIPIEKRENLIILIDFLKEVYDNLNKNKILKELK